MKGYGWPWKSNTDSTGFLWVSVVSVVYLDGKIGRYCYREDHGVTKPQRPRDHRGGAETRRHGEEQTSKPNSKRVRPGVPITRDQRIKADLSIHVPDYA